MQEARAGVLRLGTSSRHIARSGSGCGREFRNFFQVCGVNPVRISPDRDDRGDISVPIRALRFMRKIETDLFPFFFF